MAVAASTVEQASQLLAELVWLVLLAGTLAGAAAFLYRWYVREEIPAGLSLLVGLAGVTVYLNTSRALGQVIGGSTLPTEREVALFNIAAFALATGAAILGRRAGDRLGADVALRGDVRGVDREVGRLVETVGRVIAVELPEEIDDVVGYDPVPAETKEKLAGRTFLFPRRLTVGELRERLISRLTADYAVGTVDVDLAADGTVEYLALGSRAAGIGPTLPPETNAVAVRADPAFAASAGDLVQVWETDPPRRVLTAELRGVADDVVTLAIDAADTTKVDPRTEYRLVTLPVGDRPDREFASLLRAAEETFSSVVVEAGSPLHGLPVGALDVAVIAVKPEDGQAVALPEPARVLAPGDRVFAIARADALRRLESAAEPVDPSLAPGPEADRTTPATEPAPATEGDAAASDAQEAGDAVAADDAVASDDAQEAGDTTTTGAAAPDATDQPPGESTDATPAADSQAGETDPDSDEAPIEGRADGSSFQDLKAKFEAAEAEWAEEEGDDSRSDVEEKSGEDDDLAALDVEEEGDDLSSLDLDAEEDDGFGLAGEDDGLDLEDLESGDEFGGTAEEDEDDGTAEGAGEEEEDDEDGEEDEKADEEDEDGEEDGNGGSGGKSFQDLKEEFESGDADWADDVSDSPGGDMRLDE